MSSTGPQTSLRSSRYERTSSGDSFNLRKRSTYVQRSAGLSDAMSKPRGTVATAVSIACHSASGEVSPRAPVWCARTCISVKQVSSGSPDQKFRTRSARSSRPLNISASCGYLACIEGRAATDRSHDRSLANEGPAVTDLRLACTGSSVNIGIQLY